MSLTGFYPNLCGMDVFIFLLLLVWIPRLVHFENIFGECVTILPFSAIDTRHRDRFFSFVVRFFSLNFPVTASIICRSCSGNWSFGGTLNGSECKQFFLLICRKEGMKIRH